MTDSDWDGFLDRLNALMTRTDEKFEANYAQSVEDNRLVTVCSSCKMASCWRHIFCCDDYQHAGTEQLPVHHLRDLGLEHSDYYAASDDYPEPVAPSENP